MFEFLDQSERLTVSILNALLEPPPAPAGRGPSDRAHMLFVVVVRCVLAVEESKPARSDGDEDRDVLRRSLASRLLVSTEVWEVDAPSCSIRITVKLINQQLSRCSDDMLK